MLNLPPLSTGVRAMEIFRGEGIGSFDFPAVGRIVFGRGEEYVGEAVLSVIEKDTSSASLGCTVGSIYLSRTVAEVYANPSIALSDLPRSCHGQIGLLDPVSGLLFVSPDFNTVSRYSQRLYKKESSKLSHNGKPVCIYDRLEYGEHFAGLSKGFIYHLPPSVIRRLSEESLYELYRDLAEEAVGVPITIPVLRGEELCKNLRALLRGAVYGSFSLLFCGILTEGELWDCLLQFSRIFCELEAEGREFNGYIRRGFLVDTPCLLGGAVRVSGFDFCLFELPCLIRNFTGGRSGIDSEVMTLLLRDIKGFCGSLSGVEPMAVLDGRCLNGQVTSELLELPVTSFYITAAERSQLNDILTEQLKK